MCEAHFGMVGDSLRNKEAEMGYLNAAEVLPDDLLEEIQKYVDGSLLYIPERGRRLWGTGTDSREFFRKRNQEIREKYEGGSTLEELSEQYGLAYSTVRKIVYQCGTALR